MEHLSHHNFNEDALLTGCMGPAIWMVWLLSQIQMRYTS